MLKKLSIAIVALLGTATAAHAAVPQSVHTLLENCWLPCC